MAPAPTNRSKLNPSYVNSPTKLNLNGIQGNNRLPSRAQSHGSMVILGRNSTQNQLTQRTGKVTVPRPLNLPSLKKDSGVLHASSHVPSISASGWNRTESSDSTVSRPNSIQRETELAFSSFSSTSNWGTQLSKSTFPPLSSSGNTEKKESSLSSRKEFTFSSTFSDDSKSQLSSNGSFLQGRDFPSLQDAIPLTSNLKQRSKSISYSAKDVTGKKKEDSRQEQEEKWRLRQQQLKREEQQMQLSARQKHQQVEEAQKNTETEKEESKTQTLQRAEKFSPNQGEGSVQTEPLRLQFQPQTETLTRPSKATDDSRFSFQSTPSNYSKPKEGEFRPSDASDSWRNNNRSFSSNASHHDSSRNWADDERQMSPIAPSFSSHSNRFDAGGVLRHDDRNASMRRNGHDERNSRSWQFKESFHLKQSTRDFNGRENVSNDYSRNRFSSKTSHEDGVNEWPSLSNRFSQSDDAFLSKRPSSPLDATPERWHHGGKTALPRGSGKNVPFNGSSLLALDIVPLPKLGIEPPPSRSDPRLRLQRKKKADSSTSSDYVDVEREKFEAELERVQRQKEEERRKMEEEKEDLERVRFESQERERMFAVEGIDQEQKEKDRVNDKAIEVSERLEGERKTIWEEEKRRRESARRKLLELEEKIANGETERRRQDKGDGMEKAEDSKKLLNSEDVIIDREENSVSKRWKEEEEWKDEEENMMALITEEDVSLKNEMEASMSMDGEELMMKNGDANAHESLLPLHGLSSLWNRNEEKNQTLNDEDEYWKKKKGGNQEWSFHQAFSNGEKGKKVDMDGKEMLLPDNLDNVDSENQWNDVINGRDEISSGRMNRNASWEDALATDGGNVKKNDNNGDAADDFDEELFELENSNSVYIPQTNFHGNDSIPVSLQEEKSESVEAIEVKVKVNAEVNASEIQPSRFSSDNFNWETVGLGEWLQNLSQSPPPDKPFPVDRPSAWKSMAGSEFQKTVNYVTNAMSSSSSLQASDDIVYDPSHPRSSPLIQTRSLFDGNRAESALNRMDPLMKDTEYHLWQEEKGDSRQEAMVIRSRNFSSADEKQMTTSSILYSNSNSNANSSPSLPLSLPLDDNISFSLSQSNSAFVSHSFSAQTSQISSQTSSQTYDSSTKFPNADLPVVMPPLGLPSGGAFWQTNLPTIQIGSMNLPLNLGITFGELHNPMNSILPFERSSLLPDPSSSSPSPSPSPAPLPEHRLTPSSNSEVNLKGGNSNGGSVSGSMSSASVSAYASSSLSGFVRTSDRTRREGSGMKTWQPKQTPSSLESKSNSTSESHPPLISTENENSINTERRKEGGVIRRAVNSPSIASNSHAKPTRKDFKSNMVSSKSSSSHPTSSPLLPLPNPHNDVAWKSYQAGLEERFGWVGRGRGSFPLRGRGRINGQDGGRGRTNSHDYSAVENNATSASFTFTAQTDYKPFSKNSKLVRRYPTVRKVERWKEVKNANKPKSLVVGDSPTIKNESDVSDSLNLVNVDAELIMKKGRDSVNSTSSLVERVKDKESNGEDSINYVMDDEMISSITFDDLNVNDMSSGFTSGDVLRKEDKDEKDEGDDFIEVISKRRRRERQKLERAKSREVRTHEPPNRKEKSHSAASSPSPFPLDYSALRRKHQINVLNNQQLNRNVIPHTSHASVPPSSSFSSSSSSAPLTSLPSSLHGFNNVQKYRSVSNPPANTKLSNFSNDSNTDQRHRPKNSENKKPISVPTNSAWKNGFSPIQILTSTQENEEETISTMNETEGLSSSPPPSVPIPPLHHPSPSILSPQNDADFLSPSLLPTMDPLIRDEEVSSSLPINPALMEQVHVIDHAFSKLNNDDVADSDSNLESNIHSSELMHLSREVVEGGNDMMSEINEKREGDMEREETSMGGESEREEVGEEFGNEDDAEAVVALAIDNGDDDDDDETYDDISSPLDSSINLTHDDAEKSNEQDESISVSLPADLSLDHPSPSIPIPSSMSSTNPTLSSFSVDNPPSSSSSSSHPVRMHPNPLHLENGHEYPSQPLFPSFPSDPPSMPSFLPPAMNQKESRLENNIMHGINNNNSNNSNNNNNNSVDSPLPSPSWSTPDGFFASNPKQHPFMRPSFHMQGNMPGGMQGGGMHPLHPPPPLMLFPNNPFSANGYFPAIGGMGYVPAYLPTGKIPDWKHTPGNNVMHLGSGNNNHRMHNHNHNHVHNHGHNNNNMNMNNVNQNIMNNMHNNMNMHNHGGNNNNGGNYMMKGGNNGDMNGSSASMSPLPPPSPDAHFPHPSYPSGFPPHFQMDSSKPVEKAWPNLPSLPTLSMPPVMNFSPLQTSPAGFPEPSPLSSDSPPHFPDELGFGDVSLPLSSSPSPSPSSPSMSYSMNNASSSSPSPSLGRFHGDKLKRPLRSTNKVQIRTNVHSNNNNHHPSQYMGGSGGGSNNPSHLLPHPHPHNMYSNDPLRIPPDPFFHNPPMHNGIPNPHARDFGGGYRPDAPSYPPHPPVYLGGKDMASMSHRRGYFVEVRNPPPPLPIPHPSVPRPYHGYLPPNQASQDRYFRNRQGSFSNVNGVGSGNRIDGYGKSQTYKVKQEYVAVKGGSSPSTSSSSAHTKNVNVNGDSNSESTESQQNTTSNADPSFS